jgi:DNA-binding NarL/FixJ family response regulator
MDYKLSKRQTEVRDLLIKGLSNKEIALAMGISVSTAKYHIKRAYQSLGVKSRVDYIIKAHKTK